MGRTGGAWPPGLYNPHYGPLEEVSDEIFDRMMTINIRSNLRLANLVRPDMTARTNGSIVIISSIAGFAGNGMLGTYAITKAADMQLARNLAVAWGKYGIRVNAIAPGLIKTDFAKALWDNPETLNHTLKSSPLGRIGEPVDIAGVAVLLASDAGRFITGTTITVDGGVTITGRV